MDNPAVPPLINNSQQKLITSFRGRRRSLVCLAVILSLGVAGAIAWWHFKLEPALLFKRARYSQIWAIEHAIIRFNTREERLPRNVEELIEGRYLAERSWVHACAVHYESINPEPISFKNSDYVIEFTTNEAKIYLQPALLNVITNRFRFRLLEATSLSNTIASSTKYLKDDI